MKMHSDDSNEWEALRAKIIGLGERSIRKSYYPELEQRLAELERFRSLLDQSNDLIFLVEIPSGRLADVNESACRQLAYSREALLAMSVSDLVSQPIWETLAALFAEESQIDQDGKTIVTAFRHERGEMPVELSIRLVTFSDAVYAVIVARDITERKQVEEALAHERALLRTVIDLLPDSIYAKDLECRKTLANPVDWERMGMHSETEALGKTDFDIFSQDVAARFYADDQAVLQTGQPLLNREEIIVTGDGQLRWQLTSKVPLRNSAGQVVGLVGLGHDITERKQAEERILRLNRLYATLSQINQSIVRARDHETLFHEICRVAVEHGQFRLAWISLIDEATHRVEPVAFAGEEQGYLKLIDITYQDEPFGRGPTGTAIREGRCVLCQDIATDPLMIPWRDQALQRGYRASAAVPLREGGRIVGALTVFLAEAQSFDAEDEQLLNEIGLDISFALDALEQEARRRQTEAELDRLNAELEQRVMDRTAQLEAANKELEAFAYSVSHDLRAPLRHIDGFIAMLKNRTRAVLDDQSRHYMDVIAQSAGKMGVLIDDLLSFSRVGRSEMVKSQVDLNKLIDEVIQEVKPETEGREIQWKIASLPIVTGDRAMLRIVLNNLVTNAVKFTRSRRPAEIEIGHEREETEMVIFVRDNGVGFNMDYVDKLFSVFQRLHLQEDFEGTGIGLANVRRIINRHGGRTWAEGEVEKGATFYFSLPHSVRGE